MTRQKQNKVKNRVEMAIRVEMFIATCKLFTMRFFNVKVVSHSTIHLYPGKTSRRGDSLQAGKAQQDYISVPIQLVFLYDQTEEYFIYRQFKAFNTIRLTCFKILYVQTICRVKIGLILKIIKSETMFIIEDVIKLQ